MTVDRSPDSTLEDALREIAGDSPQSRRIAWVKARARRALARACAEPTEDTLAEAVAAFNAETPGSAWWYDGRDIFHKPDADNLDQIVIPLPLTWHESQRVPDTTARLVVEAVNFALASRGVSAENKETNR